MRGRAIVWGAGVVVVVLVLGLLAQGCPTDPPPQPVRVDTVPDTVLVAARPVPQRPTLGQRLTRRQRAPAVTVSQGTPDTALVSRFAALADSARLWRDSIATLTARRDTVTPRPPRPRAVLLPMVVESKDSVVVWATRSDGRMLRAAARLRGHWAVTTGFGPASDTIPQFADDAWFVVAAREAWDCKWKVAGAGGAGALLDGDRPLRGAAIAGGLMLLGCVL